jgi:hypothetical protein
MSDIGQFHMSDLMLPKGYNKEGCCFIYGSNRFDPVTKEFFPAVQCKEPVAHIVTSKLRGAYVCEHHREQILKHHLQFDPNTTMHEYESC